MTKLEELRNLLLSKGMSDEDFELMLPFLMGTFSKHLEARILAVFSEGELTEIYNKMDIQNMSFADKMNFMDANLSKKGIFSIKRFYEDFLQKLIDTIDDIFALLSSIAEEIEKNKSTDENTKIKKLNEDLETLYKNKLEDFQKNLLAKI